VDNCPAAKPIRASMTGMPFQDVPSGRARELDLSDHTHAADVIDLITTVEDRELGCFSAMLCDEHHRGLQPVCLNDLGPGTSAGVMDELLGLVLPMLKQTGGSILLARGHRGPLRATDEDRARHQRAIELCREHGVRLLGFHIATPQGVRRLPDPLLASDVA
jgi:hypothetical protein